MLTPPTPPNPPAPPPSPPAADVPDFDRMESQIKALQAQAQATQATLQQLQKEDSVASHGLSLPSWWSVAAALMLALVLAVVWRRRRVPRIHLASEALKVDVPVEAELDLQVGTEDSRFWAPEPEPEPEPDPEPEPEPEPLPAEELDTQGPEDDNVGAPAPSAIAFDLEAATSEVARVRKTLAERRQARALQRAQDAQRILDAALVPDEPAQPAAPHPAQEVTAPPANPVTSTEPDMELEFESAPDAVLPTPEVIDPVPATDDRYAVKLALAQEFEAIELWSEAQELVNEVLESGDADLLAQAQALLARIEEQQGSPD